MCPKSTWLAIFCPHHVLNIQIWDGLGLSQGAALGLAGVWGLAKIRSWDVPGVCRNWCMAGMGLPQACPGAGSGLPWMGGWRRSLAKADWVQSAFRQPSPWSQSFAKPDCRQTKQDSHVSQSRQTEPQYLSASQPFPQKAEPGSKALEAPGITTRS